MRDIKMEDILQQVKDLHPNLSETKIKAIIKEGCKNLTNEIKRGKDIQIKAIKSGVSIVVFKPHSNKK